MSLASNNTYVALLKYYLQPHVGVQRNWEGKIWHFQFRVGPEMKASYRETRPAFDLDSHTDNNNTLILPTHEVMYAHKHKSQHAFSKIFLSNASTHTLLTHNLETELLNLCLCVWNNMNNLLPDFVDVTGDIT